MVANRKKSRVAIKASLMFLFFVRLYENGDKFLSDNWTHLHTPSLFCQAFVVTECDGRKAEVGGNDLFTSGFAEQKSLSSTDARHLECFVNLPEMLLVTFLEKSFIVFYSDDFWSYGAWPSIMPMLCRGYFNFKGIALFNNPLKFTMRSLCVQEVKNMWRISVWWLAQHLCHLNRLVQSQLLLPSLPPCPPPLSVSHRGCLSSSWDFFFLFIVRFLNARNVHICLIVLNKLIKRPNRIRSHYTKQDFSISFHFFPPILDWRAARLEIKNQIYDSCTFLTTNITYVRWLQV